MADGTAIEGNLVEIYAATATGPVAGVYTAGTFEPVNDINRIDASSNRPSTSQSVFMRPTQYTTFGQREQPYTISGFKSIGDTGQGILDTAHDTNDVIGIKVLRDGVNGWSQFVRVGSRRESFAPEGLQEVSYDLGAASDRTAIGTG